MSRPYPDDRVGSFERPPATFTDAHGREVDVAVATADDHEPLREMYVAFDPADRAQGIPPADEAAVEEWLADILAGGHDVVAHHGARCVGHATLVPDGAGAFELAIFVLDTHQQAGIGSRLLAVLLGHAQREGVEHVWLTVERWNGAAVALYRKVGFETCDTESFEMEMSIRL